MRTHLQAEGDYLKRKVAHTIDPKVIAGLDRAEKRAQSVAWEIFSNITEAGWPVGTIVGSEADLMERYDCSRAVLREAVRLLEHHEVARMRRGVGGGLVVAEPSISAATQAVALHLERNGIDPTALFEVRTSVEMAVVDLAVQRIDAEGKQLLEQALAVERASTVTTFGRVGHDLHAVLGQISGNRVLELLTLVLVRLTRLRQAVPPGGRQQDTSAVVSKAHGALVAAIVAGDRELSRRRMRKHLERAVALGPLSGPRSRRARSTGSARPRSCGLSLRYGATAMTAAPVGRSSGRSSTKTTSRVDRRKWSVR